MSLRILITTYKINGRRGVQRVTHDLALALKAAGHEPVIYTPDWGPFADDLQQRGITIARTIDALEGPFDVIHGHHLVPCSGALAKFPHTPALFVCHDNESWFDTAPRLPSIVRYGAVSKAMAERVAAEAGISPESVALLLNAIDGARFKSGPALPPRPKRALAFAKNRDHIKPIQDACAERGVTVEFVGDAVGRTIDDPAKVIGEYDLVFGSALTAIEALAAHRAVIVCDGRGLGGMVDVARYEAWRPHNFGIGCLNTPLDARAIGAEIDRYDPAEAVRAGERARAEATTEQWVQNTIDLYKEAMALPVKTGADAEAQWALHLEKWAPRNHELWQPSVERQALIMANRRLGAGLESTPWNARIAFTPDGAWERCAQTIGLDQYDETGRWSSSPFVSVRFRPDNASPKIAFVLDYSVDMPGGDFSMGIEALANGIPIARWSEAAGKGWRDATRVMPASGDYLHPFSSWLTLRLFPAGPALPARAPQIKLRGLTLKRG